MRESRLMTARLHHRQMARQVRTFIGEGIGDAVANPGLGGQVDDAGYAILSNQPCDRIGVGDVHSV